MVQVYLIMVGFRDSRCAGFQSLVTAPIFSFHRKYSYLFITPETSLLSLLLMISIAFCKIVSEEPSLFGGGLYEGPGSEPLFDCACFVFECHVDPTSR